MSYPICRKSKMLVQQRPHVFVVGGHGTDLKAVISRVSLKECHRVAVEFINNSEKPSSLEMTTSILQCVVTNSTKFL